MRKICILNLDIIAIQGKIVTKPTNDAPIPSETNNAGKAQQIKVLRLVNKLKDGVINCLSILLFTIYFHYVITRVSNHLFNCVII